MYPRILITMLPVLGIIGSIRPDGPVEPIDDFVMKRIDDDEQRAIVSYHRDLSQLDLDRTLGTCQVRRRMVTLYRESPESLEYAMIMAIVAELYADHPDYYEGWRPTRWSDAPTKRA